jgi:hypothetical protein
MIHRCSPQGSQQDSLLVSPLVIQLINHQIYHLYNHLDNHLGDLQCNPLLYHRHYHHHSQLHYLRLSLQYNLLDHQHRCPLLNHQSVHLRNLRANQ